MSTTATTENTSPSVNTAPDALQQQQPNLVNTAQQQILNAALQSAGAQQQQGAASLDVASVLSKIQQLEREKQEMRSQLDNTQARLGKLQEGKRAEMEDMMNNTISKWLEGLQTKDTTAKNQLKAGLDKLVKEGNESGVWEVVACASAVHLANVNHIESLTTELNGYREKEKQLQGGLFAAEESRIDRQAGEKRKHEEIAHAEGGGAGLGGDIWGEFQSMIMSGGGNVGFDQSQGSGPNGSQMMQQFHIQ